MAWSLPHFSKGRDIKREEKQKKMKWRVYMSNYIDMVFFSDHLESSLFMAFCLKAHIHTILLIKQH